MGHLGQLGKEKGQLDRAGGERQGEASWVRGGIQPKAGLGIGNSFNFLNLFVNSKLI
jgi:hypothetical protein